MVMTFLNCCELGIGFQFQREKQSLSINLGLMTEFSLVCIFLVIIMARRDVCNLLLLSHDDGRINDEQFL